jgi:4-hydroxy-tetrahydrodipicolinate synthase
MTGSMPEGITATDLVLTVTQMLRAKGVVGKFVEFFGSGLAHLPLADRATIANMAPEYGATCGIFPIDKTVLDYLYLTGRSQENIDLVEHYAKAQGVFVDSSNQELQFSEILELDLSKVVAILSVSPYYNKPSQEGLYQHYMALADAAPKPILLYNVPGRTGRNMIAATTLRLASHPNIAGIKEAVSELTQMIAILKDRPSDFLVVSGDDEMVMAQMACGCDGVISVAANAFAKPFSDMIRFAMAGDFSMAKRVNDLLVEGYGYMFEENNPAGIKAFMFEQGLIENELRLPLLPVSAPLQAKIHNYLQRYISQ